MPTPQPVCQEPTTASRILDKSGKTASACTPEESAPTTWSPLKAIETGNDITAQHPNSEWCLLCPKRIIMQRLCFPEMWKITCSLTFQRQVCFPLDLDSFSESGGWNRRRDRHEGCTLPRMLYRDVTTFPSNTPLLSWDCSLIIWDL